MAEDVRFGDEGDIMCYAVAVFAVALGRCIKEVHPFGGKHFFIVTVVLFALRSKNLHCCNRGFMYNRLV